MVELLEGNVLLKPCQKRRVLAHLRRSSRLNDRLGDGRLAVSLRKVGAKYEAKALVHNRRGDVECKARDSKLENAVASMVRNLHEKVHAQCLSCSS